MTLCIPPPGQIPTLKYMAVVLPLEIDWHIPNAAQAVVDWMLEDARTPAWHSELGVQNQNLAIEAPETTMNVMVLVLTTVSLCCSVT